MRGSLSLCLILILAGPVIRSLDAQPPSTDYDVLIRDARIVDGTGNPWFLGDIGIRDARIITIGSVGDAKGREEINARGLVVAPGFIDIHSHSDFLLLEDLSLIHI